MPIVNYNPDKSIKEWTVTNDLKRFKGATVYNPESISNLDPTPSDILWFRNVILSDGHVVFIMGAEDHNPFIYRENTSSSTAAVSEESESALISAKTGVEIPFTKNKGWVSEKINMDELDIRPISDELVLSHLGKTQEMLVHEI